MQKKLMRAYKKAFHKEEAREIIEGKHYYMWERKEVKFLARQNLKHNYWRLVGVAILMAFLISGLRFNINFDFAQTTDAVGELASGKISTVTNAQIVDDWLQARQTIDEYKDGDALKKMGEHYTPTKGLFSRFYNSITSAQSFLYGFLNATNTIVFKGKITEGIVMYAGSVLLLLFTFFIVNVLIVGQSRFVLESRTFYDTKISKIVFVWRVGCWRKTVFTMFKKTVYQLLWSLTIVGIFIKYYSYKMIPYILAENPHVTSKQAFAMSRDMMKGNKFKTFKIDLSLIGWHMLSFLTFGLVRVMFLNPYIDTIYAELYAQLREEAIESKKEYAIHFNDEQLFSEITDGTYPYELYPGYIGNAKKWIRADYHRNYSISSIILLFFTFSMFGWVWEVLLHLFNDGVFVNRGTMLGPWLPIYGVGGVLIVLLLKRFADKPLLLFILAVVLCGIVEYTTAWFLWERYHTKWWDYSGYFLNIQGRICAEGLLTFGLGGLGFVYLLAPVCDELFKKIPKKTKTALCAVLLTLFAADKIYSGIHPNTGEGITDYPGSTAKAVTEENNGS